MGLRADPGKGGCENPWARAAGRRPEPPHFVEVSNFQRPRLLPTVPV